MAGELEGLFAVTYFGVPALAVLWNYSALPKIDWKFIVSGALMYLTGAAVMALDAPLKALGVAVTSGLGTVSAIIGVIAGLMIIGGALQQVQQKVMKNK